MSPIADANFSASLQTFVLSTGHDADLLSAPLTVDATSGGEAVTQINGTKRTLKLEDMIMMDITAVVYTDSFRPGQFPATRQAPHGAYAPSVVLGSAAQRHLALENVRLFAPHAEVELRELYTAGAGRV